MRKVGNYHSRPSDLDFNLVAYLILERGILINDVRDHSYILDRLPDSLSQRESFVVEPHRHEDLTGIRVWGVEFGKSLITFKGHDY